VHILQPKDYKNKSINKLVSSYASLFKYVAIVFKIIRSKTKEDQFLTFFSMAKIDLNFTNHIYGAPKNNIKTWLFYLHIGLKLQEVPIAENGEEADENHE